MRTRLAALLWLPLLLALPPRIARAADDAAASAEEELATVHFQSTVAGQWHDTFSARDSGPNSLSRFAENATSVVSDAWGSLRLWRGASACVNPELGGGLGLSRTLGVADFPSGEVYRVGDSRPSVVLGRAWLRQTIDLGGDAGDVVVVQRGPCQLAGTRPRDALTFTMGRISLPDQFDNVPASNDPHTRFTSWGLWASAAYDYPADTRGYTYGLTAELTRRAWSLRGAAVMEPRSANGMPMDADVAHAHGLVLEGERRWTRDEHAGSARVLVFDNFARMGSYQQVLDDPALYGNDVSATRKPGRQKYGVAASVSQEVVGGLAVFARVSWSDGANETWAFTEVDRSAASGAVASGAAWGRAGDAVGLAGVVSLLSGPHRRYLAGGGSGFMLGDGALDYGPEILGEAFYQAAVTQSVQLGAVYQPILNPGYNRARGPVQVGMIRMQAAF